MISLIIMSVLCIFILLARLLQVILFLRHQFQERRIRKHIALLRMRPEEIPLCAEQPLCLGLQPSVLTKKFSWQSHRLLFIIWLSLLIGVGMVLLCFGFAKALSLSDAFFAWGVISGFMGLIMLFVHAFASVFFYQRIEANETELVVQRGFIRRSLSWDKARLFAVSHRKDDRNKSISHWDELSDGKKVICWEYDAEISPRTAFQFSPAEYPQELICLRSYIRERTDLPLRDLRSFQTLRG